LTRTDRVPDGTCPRCGGTGFVIHEESGVERASRCICRQRQPEGDRLAGLSIPPRFRHCSIVDSPDGRGFHTPHETLELARGIAVRFVEAWPRR